MVISITVRDDFTKYKVVLDRLIFNIKPSIIPGNEVEYTTV